MYYRKKSIGCCMAIKCQLFVLLLCLSACQHPVAKQPLPAQCVEHGFVEGMDTSSRTKILVKDNCILELFVNDLDMEAYESRKARQEYYYLSDFQAYYSQVVAPVVDSMSIKTIRLPDKNVLLEFVDEQGRKRFVDVKNLQYRQGVFLFNKHQLVFWKGDKSGELDAFVRSYFEE